MTIQTNIYRSGDYFSLSSETIELTGAENAINNINNIEQILAKGSQYLNARERYEGGLNRDFSYRKDAHDDLLAKKKDFFSLLQKLGVTLLVTRC